MVTVHSPLNLEADQKNDFIKTTDSGEDIMCKNIGVVVEFLQEYLRLPD